MASPLTPCLLQSTNTEEAINIADVRFTQLVLSVKVCDPLLIRCWSADRMRGGNLLPITARMNFDGHKMRNEEAWNYPRTIQLK